MVTDNSAALYARALTLMPGGVNSPVRACKNVGTAPLFIDRAQGSRIWDADGNEFIDYVCSWGPNILGHRDPDIIGAVISACERGLTYGACHEGELELAERIKRNLPSIELLRLVSSGTEAAMSAVRAARGFTGRDRIVKFEGCYHGHSDGLLVKGGSGLLTGAVPDSAGVPSGITDSTLLAPYNDLDAVRALFDRFGEEIAAVIVEPVAANMGVVLPEEGFLEGLRELTADHGSLLIFDEVITGFRLGLGGAQGLYGIRPDLTVLGKIVGGGMPLAAYGGRGDVMERIAPLGPVYQAGTLSGNPAAVAAGNAQLAKLESDPGIYERLDKKGAALEEALKARGFNAERAGSLMTVFFTDRRVRDYDSARTCDTGRYADFYRYLLERGIYTAPSQFEAMFISGAHTEEDIALTCRIISEYKEVGP